MQHHFARLLICICFFAVSFFSASGQAIPGIGPDGAVTRAQTGFTFTEGPVADRQGNVYFSDVQRNRIHLIDTQGQLSTFLENTSGINGLMFDGQGRLIACQGGLGRIVAIDVATKAIEVLADQFQGKRFNSPNDLVVDRQGGVYFSDPVFGGTQVQDTQSVYYVSAAKQISRLISNLSRPNGVILSPDEQTLYVVHGEANVMAYPVTAPGQIGEGRVFASLAGTGGSDGLTVDTLGNLYITRPSSSAIQVLTPTGQSLGLIQFAEAPSNCDFGGADLKTLFVTARTSVYTAKMLVKGHQFGAAVPDFELTATPESQNIQAGMEATYTLNVAGMNGFSSLVNLEAMIDKPDTINLTLSPREVTVGQPATLTVTTFAPTPGGTYTITISGLAGTTVKRRTVTLMVTGQTSTDTQKPVVTTLAVSNDKVKRKKDPLLGIGWSATDNVAVISQDITYATDGTTFNIPVATGLDGEVQSFTWTVPASLAKTKTARVKVTARDAAGNSGEAISLPFQVK